MRDFSIVRSEAAKDDMAEIWLGIALENRSAAMRTVQAIDRRILMLANFPELGPERPDIADEMRMLTEGSYLILYRIDGDNVEIVRIVHGARDLSSLF